MKRIFEANAEFNITIAHPILIFRPYDIPLSLRQFVIFISPDKLRSHRTQKERSPTSLVAITEFQQPPLFKGKGTVGLEYRFLIILSSLPRHVFSPPTKHWPRELVSPFPSQSMMDAFVVGS
ncbi:hypothetical protein CDAR_421071 [Caerostris darwini]|uniref:Uncharacterized protein n=1 Tax=Caerostris darwini TaxID=1538125 RepID=A0AAV4NXF4_9ARAC|nr:hypothetical protein CDAR_421071 [Caerostris darwini]